MKALRVLLPLLAGGAIVLVGVSQLTARRELDAYRREREALRREMVERAAVARGVGGPPGVDEAAAVMRWWFEGVAGLRNRFPKQAAEPARASASSQTKPQELEAWKQYAADRLEVLRAGYAPAMSAVDQGLRLDVLAIRPGEQPDSHQRMLRVDFALWGTPRRLERESASSAESARDSLRVVVPAGFRQLGFRFVDEAGKTYGEMSGSGEPYLALKDPERFSAELPPGIVLGTWWVEPFPREAARVELSVSVTVQGMTSGALAPTFRWEVPVPEEWKIRQGETYQAETRTVAPEPSPTPRK